MKRVIIIIIISFLIHFSPALAQPYLDIGEQCLYSRECEHLLGCRDSDLGDYKICKIATPGVAGCAEGFLENMCADGMVCEDNVCRYTYGLDEGNVGFRDDEQQRNNSNPFADTVDDFSFVGEALDRFWSNETVRKVINTIFAIAFLVALSYTVKGLFMWQQAFGHVPLERKGITYAAVGAGFVIGIIFVWYVLN